MININILQCSAVQWRCSEFRCRMILQLGPSMKENRWNVSVSPHSPNSTALLTTLCTLLTFHCTLRSAHLSLYTTLCTLSLITAHYILHTSHLSLHTGIQAALYTSIGIEQMVWNASLDLEDRSQDNSTRYSSISHPVKIV